jgi:ubiquinone/menaquinone biosynthesis C-methylase UbiE
MSNPLVDYYDKRAAEYESIYAKPERQVDLATLKTLLQSYLAGHRVLEVACGTGYWTEVSAQTSEFILATDANESVLDIARGKQLAPHKVSFRQADAYALDELPRNFTALLAAFWWSHIPWQDIQKFLHSIHSFLPPGSTLVFLDNRYVESSSTLIDKRDEAGNTYQTRKLSDGSAHQVLKNFPTKEELLQTMDVGFNETSVVELDYFWIMKCKTKAL